MTERHVSDMAFRGRMRQVNSGGYRPAALPTRPHVVPSAPIQTSRNLDGFATPRPTAQPQPAPQPVVSEAPPIVQKPIFSPTLSTHRPAREHHNPTPAHSVAAPRQHRSSVLQRHSVKRSAQTIHKSTRRRRFTTFHVLVLASSLFVLSVGAAGYAVWTVKKSNGKVAGAQTDTAAKKSPFESPPSTEEYKNHTTPPDLPRYIRIPGLRINARAKQVGYSPSSGLETPANIYDVGWYGQSGRPNDERAMVFSVRTKGKINDSSYVNLDKLKLGNFIEVEQGDGNKTFYKVATISPVEPGKFNLAFASISVDSSKQGLNIISYSPTDPEANAYEPTLIVYAVRM
jgi:hypothetical protein